MQDTMKAMFTVAHRTMQEDRIPIPTPEAGEALVRIRHVGVCGSDLHSFCYTTERIHSHPGGRRILGHEAAGDVVALGEGVTDLKIGDRVALEPGSSCGVCELCRKGMYNLCKSVRFFAATGQRDGVLREYVAHPANLCFRLPDTVNTLQGALVEPLVVGLYSAQKGGAAVGMDALVLGAGCIGLMTMLSLIASGVSRVIVCDIMDLRLQKAKELGAALTINTQTEDAVEAVKKLTNGRMADLVFECTGVPALIPLAADCVMPGGTIVMVGNANGPMPQSFDLRVINNKEITIKGVFRYRNIYPVAISAIASGRIPVERIADRLYPFAQTQQAFDDAIDRKDSIVKAVIELS